MDRSLSGVVAGPWRRPDLGRLFVALGLVLVAVVWIVVEPAGKGELLLRLTETHGIDVGDLPGLALLVAAAVVARPTRE